MFAEGVVGQKFDAEAVRSRIDEGGDGIDLLRFLRIVGARRKVDEAEDEGSVEAVDGVDKILNVPNVQFGNFIMKVRIKGLRTE